MNRIAILIGSPGIPYLNGVSKDIENIKTYLKSSNGGGWLSSEIKETNLNPSLKDTLSLLSLANNADYAFVYFSGHGYTGLDNKGKINLNSNETLNISQVANRCKKQVTIIDACRGYEEVSSMDGLSEQSYFSFDTTNTSNSRNIFNQYLDYCKDGKVLLYASQKGENARDTRAGGLFSTNILKAIKSLTATSTKSVINVYSVFDRAKFLTQSFHTPHIEFTVKDALNFPLSIKSQVLDRKVVKNNSDENSQIIGGAILAIGAALLIGAIFSEDNPKK